MTHGLSSAQLETLKRILSLFADEIERVDVFGSRAQGTQRHNSDLDLVVHGHLDDARIDRLWTLFQDSNLPFSVDVKNYQQVQYSPLRAHMDEVCSPLFSHDELMQATRTSKGPGHVD